MKTLYRSLTCGIVALSVGLSSAAAFATPKIWVPWPCNDNYKITQGHNTGSHTGMGGWSWDVGIPVGGALVAPADGVVRFIRMSSTRGGCDQAYINDANYVVIGFPDGTELALTHLQANSSTLKVGDHVKRGDFVGRVGLTGWVCGAHLHMAVQNSCNSSFCQSIPATFEGFGDPSLGTWIKSNNCPVAPACNAKLSGTTTLIDEVDRGCFEQQTSYWWPVAEGHNNHHYFTIASNAAAPETSGKWKFGVDVAGDYRLEVFIPNTEASSQSARYEIKTTDAARAAAGVINQATQKGWISLGLFTFAAGADRFVFLGDNTGEAIALQRKLAFDAVRLVYVPKPVDPDPVDPDPVDPDPVDPDPVDPSDAGGRDVSTIADATGSPDSARIDDALS
nr:peptidoglycan DD-metalloendopeptidase family protein [Lujinxingiaceae bacterium]